MPTANDEVEIQEYFALGKSVADFDQRLLTVKSWGVTLSLAGLGFGFQYHSYGLFLVAAASSLAFWTLETAMKRHQMRYYPRMRQSEVNRYEQTTEPDRRFSAPRSDWSWVQAGRLLKGELEGGESPPQPIGSNKSYALAWMLPHVAFPHAITLLIGVILFLLGYYDRLGGFQLGAVKL